MKKNNKKIFLTKESNKHDGRRINARYTRVRLDAVQWRDPFVSATFIATLIWFVATLLVREIQIIVMNSIVENLCERLMRN